MTKRPKKPVPPAGWVVFPKHGSPRVELEPLPEAHDDLETTVVNKFTGALAHFQDRELVDLSKSDPRPDFSAREGAQLWGIELIEVVDPMHAQFRTQQAFAEALLKELGGVPDHLAGIDAQIFDNYQEPPFPKVSSAHGRQIVKELARLLQQDTQEIQRLRRADTSCAKPARTPRSRDSRCFSFAFLRQSRPDGFVSRRNCLLLFSRDASVA